MRSQTSQPPPVLRRRVEWRQGEKEIYIYRERERERERERRKEVGEKEIDSKK